MVRFFMMSTISFIFLIVVVIIGINMSTLSLEPKQNIALVNKIAKEVFADKPVVAQLCLAQAILESRLRSIPSTLAFKYNNLFGIKGKGTRGFVQLQTKEQDSTGNESTVASGFASNATVEDSINQYRNLLEKGTKDKPTRYAKVLAAKTFEEAATEIRKAGYATDIKYTQMLIDIYNTVIKNL